MDLTTLAGGAPAGLHAYETVALGIAGTTRAREAQKIEKAFRATRGVKRVRVDMEHSIVRITFDPQMTHLPDLHDVLLDSGYHPSRKAD